MHLSLCSLGGLPRSPRSPCCLPCLGQNPPGGQQAGKYELSAGHTVTSLELRVLLLKKRKMADGCWAAGSHVQYTQALELELDWGCDSETMQLRYSTEPCTWRVLRSSCLLITGAIIDLVILRSRGSQYAPKRGGVQVDLNDGIGKGAKTRGSLV